MHEQRSATEPITTEAKPSRGLIEPHESVRALDSVQERLGIRSIELIE